MAYTKISLKRSLKKFLESNPKSEVSETAHEDIKKVFISKPWGDGSLSIRMPENTQKRSSLVRSLNKVWLPEHFSAIYHIKDSALEVLWTSYELTGTNKEIEGRAFKIQYSDKDRNCEFKASSKDLLNIAKYTVPISAPTSTNYRNMQSFYRYANGKRDKPFGKPISFWISDVPQDSDFLLAFIKNLNFYLMYYDDESPRVLIHTLNESSQQKHTLNRYREDSFPAYIRAKSLDDNLLVFWSSALNADNITKFLHFYKILEYSAHQYVSDQVRAKLQRLILSPTALNDMDGLLKQISANLVTNELDTHQRSKKMLREVVNCKLVWREVKKHREFFQKVQVFDGGYKTKNALISRKANEDTFVDDGLLNFYERVRGIRNAMSHGKDIETQGVILPTRKNETILHPWVNLLEIVVTELMLNTDIE